jgi:hypothetical protein
MSREEMIKQARDACRDELAEWFKQIVKTGEFEKPAPAGKMDYLGHRILENLKERKP